jgi:preprotein translocase subunit YajC
VLAPQNQGMGQGIKVGDEVAIIATVLKRVTEDRVSVTIPTYDFHHSIMDRATQLVKGQQIELTGDVTRIDAGKVTVTLGTPVTVDVDKVRLVQSYVPPKRKRALIDDAD